MAVVAFIAFGLFNFTGDPVTFMVGQDATQEDRARLRADLGLDQPFYIQFGRFVGRAVQGDFGLSLRQGRSVSTLLKERVPATLELAFTAAFLALAIGIPAGVYTALRRDTNSRSSARRFARGHLAAGVPDRHSADSRFCRHARLAAIVRARANGGAGLVDDGLSHQERIEGAHSSIDYAVHVPDGADHAAGTRRDARGPAHGLHQVRASTRADGPGHPLRTCAEEHARPGHHHHGSSIGVADRIRHHHGNRSGPGMDCCSSGRVLPTYR